MITSQDHANPSSCSRAMGKGRLRETKCSWSDTIRRNSSFSSDSAWRDEDETMQKATICVHHKGIRLCEYHTLTHTCTLPPPPLTHAHTPSSLHPSYMHTLLSPPPSHMHTSTPPSSPHTCIPSPPPSTPHAHPPLIPPCLTHAHPSLLHSPFTPSLHPSYMHNLLSPPLITHAHPSLPSTPHTCTPSSPHQAFLDGECLQVACHNLEHNTTIHETE